MAMKLQYDDTQNIWMGQLNGELDAVEAPKLLTYIEEHLAIHPAGLLLDCKQLEFVDSMGLGALVKMRKLVEDHGAGVKLINMKKRIYKLFVITGLEDSFGIEVAP